MTIAYRRDVDGLRAVAVVPVVLFHAEVPGFDGGFVGVDVFFVISGFLIAGTILAERARGTFSLASFYERRARRILPALAFVAAATLIPAFWLLTPKDLTSYSESLIGIVTLSSNVVFWSQGGYFGTSIDFKPLIHTWSLAVEEQFYLVFAFGTVVIGRLAPRALVPLVVLAALCSFALSLWLPTRSPDANFYLLPSRAWELLTGALVAWWALGRHDDGAGAHGRDGVQALGHRDDGAGAAHDGSPARLGGAAGSLPTLVGLVLVLGSVFVLDRNAHSPGTSTLPAVIGTALILAFPDRRGLPGRLLGLSPMVGIGLISYSLYLWHQPLLAFTRHALGRVDAGHVVVICAASTLLSVLTWRYVERPWRNRQRISRQGFLRGVAGAVATLTVVAVTIRLADGLPQRLTPQERRLVEFLDYDYTTAYRTGRCFSEPGDVVLDHAPECFAGADAPVLFGDSHAAALATGFAAEGIPVTQWTRGACPPLLGASLSSAEGSPVLGAAGPAPAAPRAGPYLAADVDGLSSRCDENNRRVLQRLIKLQPRYLVLVASWVPHADIGLPAALDTTLDVLEKQLPRTRTVVVGSFPHWSGSLPMALVRAEEQPGADERLPTFEYEERTSIDSALARVAAGHDTPFVNLMDALCDERGCLTGVERADGSVVPFAWDHGHPTRAAAGLIACLVSAGMEPEAAGVSGLYPELDPGACRPVVPAR